MNRGHGSSDGRGWLTRKRRWFRLALRRINNTGIRASGAKVIRLNTVITRHTAIAPAPTLNPVAFHPLKLCDFPQSGYRQNSGNRLNGL
jgi:hypothetical protein